MSHHISLYAEWRDKGTNEWHLAGNGPVTLDFKHIILGDRGCWSENDRFNSFAELDPASLSPELKEYYKKALSTTPRFVQFRAIDLIEYESRINEVIERRAQKASTTLVALGMNPSPDELYEGELSVSDEWRIDDEDTVETAKVKRERQMTLPVNKELIYDLVAESHEYVIALQNKGLLYAIKESVPDGFDWDTKEVRLVAVS